MPFPLHQHPRQHPCTGAGETAVDPCCFIFWKSKTSFCSKWPFLGQIPFSIHILHWLSIAVSAEGRPEPELCRAEAQVTFGGISTTRGRAFLFQPAFRCLKFLKDKAFHYTRRVKAPGANAPGKENVMASVDTEEQIIDVGALSGSTF